MGIKFPHDLLDDGLAFHAHNGFGNHDDNIFDSHGYGGFGDHDHIGFDDIGHGGGGNVGGAHNVISTPPCSPTHVVNPFACPRPSENMTMIPTIVCGTTLPPASWYWVYDIMKE